MKFYARKILNNAFGKPFKTSDPDGQQIDMTLGYAAMDVLWGDIQADRGAPSNLKIHRHNLALKIKDFLDTKGPDTVPMDIPTEDMAMIKTRIIEAYATPLAGQWVLMVERESPKEVSKH